MMLFVLIDDRHGLSGGPIKGANWVLGMPSMLVWVYVGSLSLQEASLVPEVRTLQVGLTLCNQQHSPI